MHATSNGFVWVVNVQRSHDGIHFYVNLGAHPLGLLPDVGLASTFKEYQCAFSTRVGKGWLRKPLSEDLAPLFTQTEAVFRREVQAGVENLRTVAPQDAVVGTYHAEFHSLLFARICEAYGWNEQALRFVDWGDPHTRPGASAVREEFALLRQRLA